MHAPRIGKHIEFKGGQLETMIAYVSDPDNVRLADGMHTMLGGMPDFFHGEPLILDFSHLPPHVTKIDWPGMLSLMRHYGLQPIAICNLADAQAKAQAKAAGLAILEPPLGTKLQADGSAVVPNAKSGSPVEAEAPVGETRSTLTIDKPLRSGQQVYALGGDLVLLGGVSPGAEVIADGSIHCYGPLRGRALAGAKGDTKARIYAVNFGPELVSIAGVYRTFERGIPEKVATKPTYVYLQGSAQTELCIDPLILD